MSSVSHTQPVLIVDLHYTLLQRSPEELAKAVAPVLCEKLGTGFPELEKLLHPAPDLLAQSVAELFKALRDNPELDSDPSLEHILSVTLKKSAFGLTPAELSKLADPIKATATDDRAIVAGYSLPDDAKDVLAQITAAGWRVVGLATGDSEEAQKILKHLGVQLAAVFAAGEKGRKKDKEEALNRLMEAETKRDPKMKGYHFCLLGDMLDTDMELGIKNGLRTLWIVQSPWSEARNNVSIKLVQGIDTGVSTFSQLPQMLMILMEDIAHLEKAGAAAKEYKKAAGLPSGTRMRAAYYFPPKKVKEMIKKKFITSNDRFIFFPLQINAPLDLQGEFCALLHKCSDLMIEEFVKKKAKRFSTLQEYTERKAKSMVTIDPLRAMKMTLLRTDTNAQLELGLSSPQLQGIMKKYGQQIKIPYSKVITNTDPEESVRLVKKDIEAKLCGYSFMVKLAESCQTVESHTLTIATNEAGLGKALAHPVYKGKELIVQQIIKHSATIYKLYTLGGEYITYSFKKSLPSKLPIEEYAVFDSQKPFPKEWFTGKEDPVDKMNKDFIFEATRALLRQIDLSMLGLDYMIEEGSGIYYLVDLNYFSSFRHETDLNQKVKEHILKVYDEKVKGIVKV